MVVFRADTDGGGLGTVAESDMPAAITRLNDIQKQSTEEFGMIVGLVPCILAVATLAIRTETQATARDHGKQLAAACRDIAAESLRRGGGS